MSPRRRPVSSMRCIISGHEVVVLAVRVDALDVDRFFEVRGFRKRAPWGRFSAFCARPARISTRWRTLGPCGRWARCCGYRDRGAAVADLPADRFVPGAWGWVLAAGAIAVCVLPAWRMLSRRQGVSPNELLAFSYVALAVVAVLVWLAGSESPYQGVFLLRCCIPRLSIRRAVCSSTPSCWLPSSPRLSLMTVGARRLLPRLRGG